MSDSNLQPIIGHRQSPGLFDFLSLSQHSPTFLPIPSIGLLDDIDLDLECDTGDGDIASQNCSTSAASYNLASSMVSAEVYTVGRIRSPYSIKFPELSTNTSSHNIEECAENWQFDHTESLHNLTCSPQSVKSELKNINGTGIDSEKITKPESESIAKYDFTIIQCSLCEIQFSSEQALISHMSDKHNFKEEEFACLICAKSFKSDKSLKRHNKIHIKEGHALSTSQTLYKRSSQHPCLLCPHVSKSIRMLRGHYFTKHNSNRSFFKCDKCAFCCLKPQTLSLHMRKHEDEPKFACDQCGKLFYTMGILKRHAKTHNKSLLHACPVPDCDKAFNIKGRLTDHIMGVHKNIMSLQMANNQRNSCQTEPVSVHNIESVSRPTLPINPHKNEQIDFEGRQLTENDITVYDIVLRSEQMETFHSSGKTSYRYQETAYPRPNIVVHNETCRHNMVQKCEQSETISKDERQSGKILGTESCKFKSTTVSCIGNEDTKTNIQLGLRRPNNFVCKWANCGRTFRTFKDNYNLRMHNYTHTGEMLNACSLCRYRCVQKSALDSHMMRKHKVTAYT